jgi:hypothetical protein
MYKNMEKKMINLKEYNLVFWKGEERFIGRRVIDGHYSIYNPITGKSEPMTKRELKKIYVSDEENRKLQSRNFKRSA